MKVCTKCKKELNDVWIKIRLESLAERKRSDDTVEVVENSKVVSTETLCFDCFKKFCDLLENDVNV